MSKILFKKIGFQQQTLKISCKLEEITVQNSTYKNDKIQLSWKLSNQVFETPMFRFSQFPKNQGKTYIKQALLFEVMETFYIDPSRDIYLPKISMFQLRSGSEYFKDVQFELSQCISFNFEVSPRINKSHSIDLGMGVTAKVVIDIQNDNKFYQISDGDLNWSDMQSMQDIV